MILKFSVLALQPVDLRLVVVDLAAPSRESALAVLLILLSPSEKTVLMDAKLVELDGNAKIRVRRVSIGALVLTAIVCCILVGCFACRQEAGKNPEMTDAQKVLYWKGKVLDVFWSPQTNATHDGVLKDLYLASDAKTALDTVTGKFMVYFLFNNDEVMKGAVLDLTSEEGTLTFSNDDVWTVKSSEKNGVMYMTVRDSEGKEVYYQER